LVVSDPRSPQPFTRLTSEGLTSGTPGYMAPEIAEGREIDARADLYALGCVAYWMLTGTVVFESSSPMKVLLAHVQSAPVPPSERSPHKIPSDLEQLVLALLKKTPEQRPKDARELRKRLEACSIAKDWTEERASIWWSSQMSQTNGTSQAAQ
jgi:serine/threonine-protein kinase